MRATEIVYQASYCVKIKQKKDTYVVLHYTFQAIYIMTT